MKGYGLQFAVSQFIRRLPLMQVPEAEVEAEVSSAANEFRASGQDFDEQRLREQVVEALKARLLTLVKRDSTMLHVAMATSDGM